jgi:hypothetical protein
VDLAPRDDDSGAQKRVDDLRTGVTRGLEIVMTSRPLVSTHRQER